MSLKKLFDYKIGGMVASLLLDSLNMERSMFHKREISKSIIKKNKWEPREGEKVRLVDSRCKPPHRSYPATIKKVLNNQICLKYDGYPDDPAQWIKRNEWAGRITILEDIKPQSTVSKSKSLNKTTSVRNTGKSLQNKQNDDINFPQLSKPKSVPPTDVSFVLPFRNKIVQDWNNDDVVDWIDSIKVQAAQKYQSKITQHKLSFKRAALANQLTGKLLLGYTNGHKLFEDYKRYKLSEAFCNKAVEQLQ
eukprot:367015_1